MGFFLSALPAWILCSSAVLAALFDGILHANGWDSSLLIPGISICTARLLSTPSLIKKKLNHPPFLPAPSAPVSFPFQRRSRLLPPSAGPICSPPNNALRPRFLSGTDLFPLFGTAPLPPHFLFGTDPFPLFSTAPLPSVSSPFVSILSLLSARALSVPFRLSSAPPAPFPFGTLPNKGLSFGHAMFGRTEALRSIKQDRTKGVTK